MNIPNWDQRSIFTANLLNPAFCGEVLRRSFIEYNKIKKVNEFSFALTFFILPLALYKKTRDSLPRTKRTKLHDWLTKNESLKLDLINRIEYLVPFTREAIIFLYQYGEIDFSNDGKIILLKTKQKKFSLDPNSEVGDILNKSNFLGKWMTTFPEDKITFSFFGILP